MKSSRSENDVAISKASPPSQERRARRQWQSQASRRSRQSTRASGAASRVVVPHNQARALPLTPAAKPAIPPSRRQPKQAKQTSVYVSWPPWLTHDMLLTYLWQDSGDRPSVRMYTETSPTSVTVRYGTPLKSHPGLKWGTDGEMVVLTSMGTAATPAFFGHISITPANVKLGKGLASFHVTLFERNARRIYSRDHDSCVAWYYSNKNNEKGVYDLAHTHRDLRIETSRQPCTHDRMQLAAAFITRLLKRASSVFSAAAHHPREKKRQ